jgi:outer membrane murein-binding lipoprotein Lpp
MRGKRDRCRHLLLLGVVSSGLLVAGCSTNQAASDLGAPLSVIPKTDVVVETNIQAVVQAAQAVLQTTQSLAAFGPGASGGTSVTTGPSTSAGQISYAVAPGGNGIVFVGWNKADQHCIGQVYVAHPLASPVLSQSAPGQYDFVAPAGSSSSCDAASYLAEPSVPSGWPEDPSAGGWPAG